MSEGIRLNKYLSEAGICSRREADRRIESGDIRVDGQVATLGTRVFEGQIVTYKNVPIKNNETEVVLAFHKPVGIVCTTSKDEKDNIVDFIHYPKRIYPCGRLDKNSSGLILMTNNGQLMDNLLRSRNSHEKEYIVSVNKPLTEDFIRGMQNGVPILDTVTKPCQVKQINSNTFNIILTQGLNRQIRRMCEYFDYKVVELKRVRIMNLTLGTLNVGQYRELDEKELEDLKRGLSLE